MKRIFALAFFALGGVACNSGNSSDVSSSDPGCDEFNPINVDGYFNTQSNPRILGSSSDTFGFLVEREQIFSILDQNIFRIGVGATYNLNGADPQTTLGLDVPDNLARGVCLPPARISLGPVLTDLDIVANQLFISDFPVGSSLKSLFSVTVLEQAMDANFPPTQAIIPDAVPPNADYVPLDDYVSNDQNAPVVYFLRLDVEPPSEVPVVFTISYVFDNGVSGSFITPQIMF